MYYLQSLKELLSTARQEFQELQIQLNSDLEKLGMCIDSALNSTKLLLKVLMCTYIHIIAGGQVQEMSVSAQKYHKVVQENRNLYNMVQDLKGTKTIFFPCDFS